MSLLFSMMSRLVIAFLPKSKCLLISWLYSLSAVILEPENKVCHCFHCFPIYLHEVMGPDAMILVFWVLSFKLAFSLSSFTFIKRLLISSLLSAIRVLSSAYLRLLIFLLAISITVSPPSWIFLPSIPHFTPLGLHRAPDLAPWTVEQLLTNHLLYIW